MFVKNKKEKIMKDIGVINKYINENKIDNKILLKINKYFFDFNNLLKEYAPLKKIGSFAINNIYKFDKKIKVDILAQKFVSNKMYNIYNNEIKTKDHFDDCWMCEINQLIFEKLIENYKKTSEISIFKHQEIIRFLDGEETYENYVSIIADIDEQYKIEFCIRTGLITNDLPVIICNDKKYLKSFCLDYIKTFKSLDSILNKKLSLLFLYIQKKFLNILNRKLILLIKHKIMSEILLDLSKSEDYQVWATYCFNTVINNSKVLDEIFQSKNLYYKANAKFDRLHQCFLLKKLRWFMNKRYSNTKKFIDEYLTISQKLSDEVLKGDHSNITIWFLYETNIFLTNSTDTSNFVTKKKVKYINDKTIQFVVKNVYPSDKDIGNFVLFLNYYRIDFK